ncbi:MAG: nucleoside 2-deoxyribosyltransferase [Methanobacteriota archaeon]
MLGHTEKRGSFINQKANWIFSRKLYFPIGLKKAKNTYIFVAARFTTAIENGIFDSNLRKKIEIIHEVIRSLGVKLYSSHHIEKFGENLSYYDRAVKRDISQISRCDIFVALLEDKLSAGVCTELGWASFVGKKIILIIPDNFDINRVPMIKGLTTITYCEIVRYADNNILRDRLHSVLQPLISK